MPLRATDQLNPDTSGLVCVGHERTPADLNGTCRQRPHITLDLEHPPQRHVRKKLDSDFDRRAAFHFEWIAFGLTVMRFWTVTWRLIRSLESPVRLTVETLPDSIESP